MIASSLMITPISRPRIGWPSFARYGLTRSPQPTGMQRAPLRLRERRARRLSCLVRRRNLRNAKVLGLPDTSARTLSDSTGQVFNRT